MSTSKRIISLLLALVMVLGMLPWDALGVEAAGLVETVRMSIESAKTSSADLSVGSENNSNPTETTAPGDAIEVTRAQWLQMLVETFSMTVENEVYPDNYFSDLSADSEYYYDMLLAVEFGVVDIPAGGELRPDEPATREFAARTMNFCLGFQLEPGTEYTFDEADTVAHPNDIQIAIDRGWMEIMEGCFLPEEPITREEADAMTADAAEVMASNIIDENFQAVYTYTADVVEIPVGTKIETAENTVTIYDSPVSVRQGSVFVVYFDGLPCLYRADSVLHSENRLIITVSVVDESGYYDSLETQGIVDAKFTDFIPAEGTEVVYIDEETGEEYLDPQAAELAVAARGMVKINRTIKVRQELGRFGTKGYVEAELKNPKIEYNFSLSQGVVYVKLISDTDINYGIEGSLSDALEPDDKLKEYLELGFFGVKGIGGITVSVCFDIEASMFGSISGKLTKGLVYDNNGLRLSTDFRKTSFSMVAELSGNVGINFKLGLTDIPGNVIEGYVYGEIGGAGKVTQKTYEDSVTCLHAALYAYSEYGFKASVKLGFYKKSYESVEKVWDEYSSPIRIYHHYENGVLVPGCTKDKSFNTNYGYYTPTDSPYWGSNWSGGYNGTGYNSSGEPVIIFNYSLDDKNNAIITSYSGNATSLTIPKTLDGYNVIAIGAEAFKYKTGLRTVIMQDNILNIGSSAFYGCTNLRNLTLSESIATLGYEVFRHCSYLTTVDIPDSVTEIGGWAFADCNNLQSVKLSKGLVNIGRAAFNGCSKLTEITIPKSLVYCDGLQDYPEYGVFHETNLTTVHWEDGVTRVVEYLFQGCESLKQITIPDTVTEIRYEAFADSGLTQVVIPNSVTTIWWGAFENCVNLTTVDIPDSVIEIGGWAFADCTNLQSVKLSKGLVNLGRATFNGCSKLTEITIPKSLVYCDGLQNYPEDGVFHGTNLTTVHWEDGVTRVVEYLFQGCESLKQVTIPNTVTEIRYEAFADSGLTQIVIPNSVTTIWWGAFENCFGLNAITFSEKLEKIDSGAFENCTGLTSVEIPDSVVTIESYAFKNCKNLDSITLSKSLIELERETFRDCDALVEIVIPENVRCIRSACFYDCDALKSIAIPFGITFIEDSAFYDCDALETVDMANSVTSLGSSAFKHCDVLKNVKLSRNLTAIPSEAFRECAELEEIVIPYFTTKIDSNAFNSSPKLKKVVTHEKLAAINTSAFSYADRTVFYGPTGSYTNTWCTENGYSFVENTAATTKVTAAESSVTIPKGKTYMLDFDIDPIDFHELITTKSSNTAVATVDEAGKITAVAPGTATIKIIVGGASASCKVTVTQGVTKITLDKTKLSLDVPETYQLTATITPADASNKTLNWTSSNPAAATVDENGLVTAVGNGTAVIKAESTDGTGISASCTVTVIDPSKIPVSSITLDKSALSLEAMEIYQLTASVSPANAANKALIWTSSNEAVATVDSNGLVTAVAKGTATITATAADGYGTSANCTVTVTNNGYVVASLDQFQSSHPYENSCTDFWLYTQPGAGSVSIVFDAETEMEDGFDYLYIHDGEGNLIGKYTGTELANQTITIPGDTVKVQIESDDSGNAWGFRVTDIGFTDHTHSFTNYVSDGNATCTEDGTKTAKCKHCDATDTIPDAGSALGHDMGSWETIVPATCTENGEEQRNCSRCDHSESRVIEAVGHQWDKGIVTREPTEETEGERLYTCTACGATKTESIPVIGHEHRYEAVVTAPTCTERGYTTYTCKCGESYVADYVDALGHSFGDWTVIQEPTTTEDGLEERSCSRCDYTEQRTVAKLENPFNDVVPGSFYYEPVMWAIENGITNGTSATTFGPNDQCMRAHVVTFLWRAVGSPEPTRTDNPFVDVKSTDFYYKPVLWALENGITSGMDATHFGPTSYCNRAQVVTFLYRTMGSPELDSMDNPFTDVQAGAFYEKPVLWAVQNGITNGLSATSFGPGSICNRAQIVTFLYRAFVND